ncbi:Exopolysaccharide glucosyl ketal-pyruvate-transferase [Granulosicoccus antarcticus IMCC3135]|uniref:Exopolysaccharide glucosyl ketal-pyruvate-transferase n=2 Tax=Granulosicoccus TaxID=437504 RepID=A0A2Z2NR85_9GAMM|nr:Exopolysaccharide glucosyl ketal-pyruvate-transferase [Granulosicoccus antarcticus IMCC3135]
MIIEYCRTKNYNFGDDLNPWIWPRLLGDELLSRDDGIYLVGIGTLLTSKRLEVQLKDAKEVVIFSSGTWGDNAPALPENCKVYGVRGPRTAKRLGLSEDKAIGDGAYLLRKVDLPAVKQTNDIGFMPHHRSEQYIDWQTICDQLGIKFITAQQPVDDCLAQLRSCKRVITEAMHGAIVADAMRIPWTPVKFSPLFREDKWYDFAESMQLKLSFYPLPFINHQSMPFLKMVEVGSKKFISQTFNIKPKWQELIFNGFGKNSESTLELIESLKEVISLNKTCMSSDEVVESVTDKQYELVSKLKEDYKAS